MKRRNHSLFLIKLLFISLFVLTFINKDKAKNIYPYCDNNIVIVIKKRKNLFFALESLENFFNDFSQNRLLTLSPSNGCSFFCSENLLIPTNFASTGHILANWRFSNHHSKCQSFCSVMSYAHSLESSLINKERHDVSKRFIMQ